MPAKPTVLALLLCFSTSACAAGDLPADPAGADAGVGGGGGGGSEGAGGGTGFDAGPEGPPAWWGEPVDAPKGEWTWIDFPETVCADGSSTGLAINLSPSPNPSGVLFYFEGGGACWDYEACSLGVEDYALAFHADGYDQADWDGEWGAIYKAIIPFKRDSDENPWRDAHHVFVPYCTADVFGGDRVTELVSDDGTKTKTMHYRGHHNVGEYLERLVPTFEDVPRVWLTGSSAGGFGAELNWFQFVERFGDVRVDVISDSGQPVMPSVETWQAWLDTWGLVLPAGCSDCEQGISETLRYGADTLLSNGSRFGLIVYDKDLVISTFLGLSVSAHESQVHDVLAAFDDPAYPNSDRADYFAKDGYFHTTFLSGITSVEAETVPLWQWLTMFVNDDPALTSLGPD